MPAGQQRKVFCWSSLILPAVNLTACKRLFSLGCVLHTDGAVLQGQQALDWHGLELDMRE